jgi:hypothetical protein
MIESDDGGIEALFRPGVMLYESHDPGAAGKAKHSSATRSRVFAEDLLHSEDLAVPRQAVVQIRDSKSNVMESERLHRMDPMTLEVDRAAQSRRNGTLSPADHIGALGTNS